MADTPEEELKAAHPKKIPLVEMFGPTIQGEGSVIGQQTYFLRFGLCDYRCKMCDSLHAVLPSEVKRNARWLTEDEIFDEFMSFKRSNDPSTNWVTFSGGNPAIHNLSNLVMRLRINRINVHVETQGTFAPGWLNLCNSVTISPKGPGMGEVTDINVLDNFLGNLKPGVKHDMKIVIFDRRDVDFAIEMFGRYISRGFLTYSQCYLSLGNMDPPVPNDQEVYDAADIHEWHDELLNSYRQLFEEIQHDPTLCHVKFLPQWHTFVWGNAQAH